MNAEYKPNIDTQRTVLADVIPLSAPYTIVVEITRLCNFRCYYCIHSTKDDPNGAYQQSRIQRDSMDGEMVEKLVRDIMQFSVQPKRILFQGLGEPLMSTELPRAILLLREAGFTGRIDVMTNGSLLTHSLSDRLVEAGLSQIDISIQGLSTEDYKAVSQYHLNFDAFLNEIKYLYDHRKKTKVYIKIIDAVLKGPGERDKFFDIFGNLCDSIFIEHLVENQIQMGDIGGRVKEKDRTIFQKPVRERAICQMIFYQIQVLADGAVLACVISDVPRDEVEVGNIHENMLTDIWNGKVREALLKKMLKHKRFTFSTCSKCMMLNCITDKKELLDDKADMLLKKLEVHYAIGN